MKKFIILGILVITSWGCSNNYYQTGEKLFSKKNYVSAIEQYDLSIEKDQNGARKTKAELARSESYYQLGLMAFEKENWLLATRLLFLSNSITADQYLDNCYYKLSETSFAESDTSATLDYYEKIISYLPESEMIPEIYFNRINIYLNRNELFNLLEDFKQLWNNHRDDQFTKKAHPLVDAIIPSVVSAITSEREHGDLVKSIETLHILEEYSIQHKDLVNTEIALTYTQLAEAKLASKDFSAAYQYFLSSFQYDALLAQKNKARIDEIRNGFTKNGDDHLKNFQFEQAISCYEKCFLIMPKDQIATDKIAYAKHRKIEAKEAELLFDNALTQERDDKYQAALKIYLKSQKLVNNSEVKTKIFEMKNLMRAIKEPRSFAQEIVLNYQKGKLVNNVYAIEDSMLTKYGDTVVEVSGWKVLFTSNNLKYDVRYDIISPYENYYFIWKVDLRNRKLTAMNKRSDELLN